MASTKVRGSDEKHYSKLHAEYSANPLQHTQIVVLSLIDTGEKSENYITAIASRASKALEKEFSVPHMASILERFVDKGLCTAKTVQPTEGGRARRYYAINEKGKVALNESWKAVYGSMLIVKQYMAAT